MINNLYKTIHNKYLIFFRFIFFLRHLFGLFFVAAVLFLIIPNFFNYEKRAQVVKDYLIENYNFKVQSYDKIEFHSLPFPRLELKNVQINLDSSSINLNVRNLKIYLKLLSIYNYKNFKSNKIKLEDNNVVLESSNFKFLLKNFFNQKNKLLLDNLNIEINNENKTIIKFKNIVFANFGYKKDLLEGKVFSKKFKIKTNNELKNITFELLKSGISAEINFDDKIKKDLISGIFKSKILNTNLKFSFDYDNESLSIYNSYFRSKNLSFNNNSAVIIKPFLSINSEFKIEDIDVEIFKKLNLNKILGSKNILKKINTKNEFNFIAKKFSRDLVDELNLKIDLAYGRLGYLKKFSISDNLFRCEGNLNFLEEYPLLFFECSITLKNKKDLLKKFSIISKNQNEISKLIVKGNLNILNKKINFKNISLDKDYKASNEDLEYFKAVFENILFDESFVEIFSLHKIKEFILEIS